VGCPAASIFDFGAALPSSHLAVHDGKVVGEDRPRRMLVMKIEETFARPNAQTATLTKTRKLKMSRSAHAYVRGNTLKFYEWLNTLRNDTLPHGPAIWICGDCHIGNLGPLANSQGGVEIQIRDFDQTVIFGDAKAAEASHGPLIRQMSGLCRHLSP
jgi:hypothetical protein